MIYLYAFAALVFSFLSVLYACQGNVSLSIMHAIIALMLLLLTEVSRFNSRKRVSVNEVAKRVVDVLESRLNKPLE